MSRRHSAEKREVIPDAKYGDVVIAKFMNSVMYDGKKSVAESIVYGALEAVEAKLKTDPLQVFRQALDNVAPAIEVRSRRVKFGLPTVMREGAVGFRHTMRVFALLDGTAAIIRSIHQFSGKTIHHRLVIAAASGSDEPANGQRLTAF